MFQVREGQEGHLKVVIFARIVVLALYVPAPVYPRLVFEFQDEHLQVQAVEERVQRCDVKIDCRNAQGGEASNPLKPGEPEIDAVNAHRFYCF